MLALHHRPAAQRHNGSRRHHPDVEHCLLPDRFGEPIRVKHHPWLLSDNGSAFFFHDLRDYLEGYHIDHVRGAVHHPQIQGRIERWHCSVKNVIMVDNYYLPRELEQAIGAFVDDYNHQRYVMKRLTTRSRQTCTWIETRR